jgi:uracil phosphoribosyltransferase
MEVILTTYCKQYEVSYKQGMNYVLAPLFLLNLPDRDAIYSLYVAFISKLQRALFSDNDFGSLQCTFLLFKMSLQYHDPELALFLDQHDMGPELYASSWFITLFSNRCKMSVLFYLWDCLILDNGVDQQLAFWVSLALLIQHRQAILHEQIVMLPESLSKLTIQSKKEASVLVNRAKKLYRAQASATCRAQLQEFTSRRIGMDSVEYHKLLSQSQGVLLVSEEELVRACYGETKSDGSGNAASTAGSSGTTPLKFFILDCRPLEQYEAGHLPCAYHLDPELLLRPSELNERVESLGSMQGCHWCFLGEGGERPETVAGLAAAAAAHPSHATSAQALLHAQQAQVTVVAAPSTRSSAVVKSFIQIFLKRGFKYLSNCESGYAGCHALILASDHSYELIDHNQSDCLECTGRRKMKEQKKSFLQNVKRFAGNVISRLEDTTQESLQEYQSTHLPETVVVLLPSHSTAPGSSPLSPGQNAVPNLSLKLLMTVIRDKSTDLSSFADALQRITSVLVATFLERVEVRERNVSTGAGAMFTGLETLPVCTITIHPIALELLDSAFHPFRPVCKRQSATYKFEALEDDKPTTNNNIATTAATSASPESDVSSPRSSSSAAPTPKSSSTSTPTSLPSHLSSAHLLRHITVPSNLLESAVLLFLPLLTPLEAARLFDILADLVHTRGVEDSQITVVCLLAARPTLWKLYDSYPGLIVMASCVDELTSNNRLVPGISADWETRYNSSK